VRLLASKLIVLSTFGSLGDLHPFMGLALELQARGHRAVIATSEVYRARVEGAGLGFQPVRPDLSPTNLPPMELLMDAQKGPQVLLRQLIFPRLRESYDDLRLAIKGADLLVTGELSYAGRILAEQTGLPWLATVLAPFSFFSAHDPPVLVPAPALAKLRRFGPTVNRTLASLTRMAIRSWSAPVRRLRSELGLPPGGDPIFEARFSPHGVLALFSSVLARPQPDWPPGTLITGFILYDRGEAGVGLGDELSRFLADGPPPIVFTLGSAAVYDPRSFFVESIAAARRLGRRAVLLVGKHPQQVPLPALPDGIVAFDDAPYTDLVPRAAAIVHQGGIGTTAQALRAGRPMLVMPYGFDQPDNAARVMRLGVARTINRRHYRAERVASELTQLLTDSSYIEQACRLADQIQAEHGATAACDAIEARL
jgi:UDP:flavonoid glycosyltransferase YjiC (YdhE family)